MGPNGPIEVTGLDMNSASPAGTPFTFKVYTVPGTAVGNIFNMAAWTLVSSGSGTSAGTNVPSPVTLNNTFVLPAGSSWGVAYVPTGVNNRYTNGNGANEIYMDGTALTLTGRTATNVPFTGTVFTPRVANTTLYYNGPRQP